VSGKPTIAEHRRAIVDLAELLDKLPSIRVNVRKVRHATLLQGLCFYVHDTCKAALVLVDGGYLPSAAALTRIAVEHAAMAQWIVLHPEGAEKYLAEMEAQANTFAKKAKDVGVEIPEDVLIAYRQYENAKPVPEIRQTETMFAAVDPSGWMYLHWKSLCGFVHPSSTTTTMYVEETPDGATTWVRGAKGAPEETIIPSLALSILLATAPLLDLVKGKPHKKRLMEIATAAGLPLWATQDGRPPKKRR